MSQYITEAFVQAFDSTFRLAAQQQQSRFEAAVTIEPGIRGTSKSFNFMGPRTAVRRTTRHGDTPINDQTHSTRYIDLIDYQDGDMIDDQDKLKMLIDPGSGYIQGMVSAMNRAKDDVLITAIRGSARSSTGSVALPSGQKVAVSVGGPNTGMNRAKLVAAAGLFRANECDVHNGEELYLALGNVQIQDLLADNTLTNTERDSLWSLQTGQLAGGLLFGFRPVFSERLVKSGNSRYCLAWAKSGVCLGIGENVMTRVGEDPGREFNTRFYARQSLGAVRGEDVKVVEIASYEA